MFLNRHGFRERQECAHSSLSGLSLGNRSKPAVPAGLFSIAPRGAGLSQVSALRFSAAALAIVFAVSLMTSAQGAVPGDNTRRPGDQGKGVNLSGQVSKDGKAFVADDYNTWAVNNSGVLKGFAGRYLTVK